MPWMVHGLNDLWMMHKFSTPAICMSGYVTTVGAVVDNYYALLFIFPISYHQKVFFLLNQFRILFKLH